MKQATVSSLLRLVMSTVIFLPDDLFVFLCICLQLCLFRYLKELHIPHSCLFIPANTHSGKYIECCVTS